MLHIISDAMRVATRNDTQSKIDRERYMTRRAAAENDAEFHRRMLLRSGRHWG